MSNALWRDDDELQGLDEHLLRDEPGEVYERQLELYEADAEQLLRIEAQVGRPSPPVVDGGRKSKS